jgi:hypothetical protein
MNGKTSESDRRGFIATQRSFIDAIRDPQNHPTPPDIEERRMAVYRDLFYNNVEDFLASTFPVLKELLGADAWHEMVRDYFARHRSKTPLFMQMPKEFLVYLEREREPRPNDFPFLLELAHYEWVELALATSDEKIDMAGIDANGDLLTGKPVLSPLAWILTYRFAVHRIGTDYVPSENDKEETCLIVFRNRNDEVEFIEINRVTATLLLRLQKETGSAQSVLLDIAAELKHPEPHKIVEFGNSILNDLHGRGVILGSRI